MTAEQNSSPSGREKRLAVYAFLLIGIAAYSNSLGAYFLSDDFAQIGRVLEGDLSVTWGREHGGFFRPLFVLSLFIDAAVWGRAAFGFHLTNVTLHALNSSLVFLLALRLTEDAGLDAPRRRWTAAAAGMIFLLHPSHTEAVTWISGRPDLLSTLFCLLSLLAFDSYTRAGRRRQLPRLAASLVAFALALLSKEAAVCLPLVVFLLELWRTRARGRDTTKRSEAVNRSTSEAVNKDTSKGTSDAVIDGTSETVIDDMRGGMSESVIRALKSSAPFLLVLALYVAARTLALGALLGGYGAAHHLNFTHSMIVSQLLRFPLRALFPAVALRSFPFLESRALSPTLIVTGCVVVIVLAVTLAREGGRRRVLGFLRGNKFLWLLLALFLAALAPVINLRIEVFTTQGERFLYLPTVFFSIALAHVALKLARGARARPVIVLAVLALYAFALWRTNAHWRDTARLSRDALAQIARLSDGGDVLLLNLPDNFLGAHLFRNGVPEALGTFQDAKQFRRVDILAWHNLRDPRDGAELSREAEVFTLRLPGDATAFERFNEPPEFLEVTERSEKLLRFRLRDATAREIFYFGNGEMIKLTER